MVESDKRKASDSSGKSTKKGKWDDSLRHALCVHHEKTRLHQEDLVLWLEKEHGVKIAQSTVSATLKKGKEAYPISDSQRHREAEWPLVEKALYEWIVAYQNSISITGEMVKTKAAIFFQRLHSNGDKEKLSGNKWSNGWLAGFQTRHGIKNWRRHGESGSVKAADITTERPKLQSVLSKYSTRDIYNMDETGLFWKLQRDTGLSTEQLRGTKKDKTRVKVVCCTNMEGTEKLDLWIVGKFKSPRAFKDVNMKTLGCHYKNTAKAWMTGALFTEWVQWFDKQMAGRQVILLLDNASSHSVDVELRWTTIHYLPPNTTSVLQPMDQGIIRSFKAHYRKNYYVELLRRMEEENREEAAKSWDILDAVNASVDAWRDGITQKTIFNCWAHAQIKVTVTADGHAPVRIESPEPGFPEEKEIEQELDRVITGLGYANRMQINFLLNHPEERVTEAVPTEEEIVAAVLDTQEEETEQDILDMGGWNPKPKVKSREALKAARILEQWALEQASLGEFSAAKVRNAMTIIKNTAQGEFFSGATQTTITSFFKPL